MAGSAARFVAGMGAVATFAVLVPDGVTDFSAQPAQETVLAMDLFKSGHRPSLMIFMDGVNLGEDEDVPTFTDRFERQFAERQLVA